MTVDEIRDQFGAILDVQDADLSSVHCALKHMMLAYEARVSVPAQQELRELLGAVTRNAQLVQRLQLEVDRLQQELTALLTHIQQQRSSATVPS